MSEEVRFTIDGDEPAPTKRHTDADAHAAAETEKTRRAFAERNAAHNELLQARREQAAVALDRVNAEAEHATQGYQQAWERGDAAKMAECQREIAALEVKRNNAEAYAAQLDRAQPVPTDPVEAFAAGRQPQSQAWIRAHPEYVLNDRKFAKMNAAHSDAVAEGITPDTEEYFSHVNKFLGLEGGGAARRSSSDSGGESLRVRVTSDPNRVRPGEIHMTPGEHKAATETLTWPHDSPDGKHKRGEPLGVAEYLRRKGIMKREGRYDKLESY